MEDLRRRRDGELRHRRELARDVGQRAHHRGQPGRVRRIGNFYRATTTGPTVAVTNAGNFTLQVSSTAGLQAR